MKRLLLIPLALLASPVFARLGETQVEMTARFGKPVLQGEHSVFSQGKRWPLGPNFQFRQGDWQISADLVDGRCVRIAYAKRGEWTEEQIELVIASNSQGGKWTETSKPHAKKYSRSWKRSDGATAEWSAGGAIKMVVTAYKRAQQVVEAKAKAEASRKPRI